MARIIIAGDAMIVESAHTLETLQTLEKHRPKALTLYDEDGKTEVFKVGTTSGKGNINTYGASFGSVSKNGEKKAIITMEIPANIADAEAYAEDVIGNAIIKLNAVEAQFESALDAVDQEKATIRESITVM